MNIPSANLISLFGTSGSGKTWRLKTIEQQASHAQVLRIGAETLVDDIVAGICNGLMAEDLVAHYRGIDTLLIDNLWVLVSRPQVSMIIRQLVESRMADGLLTVLASDMTLAQWSAKQPEMAGLLAKGETVQFCL
jgi:chromosomal replication initiation ATPase DnaA